MLRDKASELAQFQIEVETKATQRAATVEERLVQQEQELQQVRNPNDLPTLVWVTDSYQANWCFSGSWR